MDPKYARACARASLAAEERGVREHRQELLTGLAGSVCEVGAGSGLNFARYPSTVTRIVAVEPDPTLRAHAEDAARRAPVPVEVIDATAERLPLPDASVDAVVVCLVLCSVDSPAPALAEARRVLRPGGDLRFYEHVRSELPLVGRLEDAVAPLWARFQGGCHPNRDAVAAVTAAGFEVTAVRRFAFSAPRLVPPVAHVIGRAANP